MLLILALIFSTSVAVPMLLHRVMSIICSITEEQIRNEQKEFKIEKTQSSFLIKSLGMLKTGLDQLISISTDLELIYYAIFWILLIAAATGHPLLISLHISIIIIRSGIIKDLINAIFSVLGKILCSLLTMLLVIYWLTIWSYTNFSNYYPENSCNSLLKCFYVNFDQNFKNNGGAGTYISSVKQAYDSGPCITLYINI